MNLNVLKKIGLVGLAVVMMVTLTIGLAPAKEQEKVNITATARNLVNVYWVKWNKGGKQAAEALGANYNFISGEDKEAVQLEAVETAIVKGADAVVFQPVADAIVPQIVRKAEENKTFLVTMWDKPAELNMDKYEYWAAHVTQDSEWQGYTIAKKLFEKLDGNGNIVAIGGIAGTQCAEDRRTGLLKALDEFPNINLLAYQSGEYKRSVSLSVMEDFIAAYGDKIDGVWCANDEIAMGAIKALEAADMEVPVVGVDATEEAVQAIIDGKMYLTLGGDARGMHGLGVLIAFDSVKGYPPKKDRNEIFWKPPIVTPENATEYYTKMFEKWEPHPWKEWSKFYSRRESYPEELMKLVEIRG